MYEKKKLGDDGFSIVEAMVAIVILSIIFIPITNTFISSIKASQETKIMQEATSTAQAVMEDFKEETLLNLCTEYTLESGDISTDSWPLKLKKEILRADNDCCDFTVDINVSKVSTNDKTKGLSSTNGVNNFDVPQIVSMNSPSSCVITGGEVPQWVIENVAKKASASIDDVKSEIKRKFNITLTSATGTGNTEIKCEVNYFYKESVHPAAYETETIEMVTLSTKLKNLYLYYTAGYNGENDFISFDNSEALSGNFYVIGEGKDASVTNFTMEQRACTNLDRFHVITSVKITGGTVYNVSTDSQYVPDTEKETRRYEVTVTVKKKSNDKVYSSMVSTRGE